jgi:hypothetical protein
MSTSTVVEAESSAEVTPAGAEADLSEKQRRILAYLRESTPGQTYFKSRLIAEELGLSAKEVGSNIGALQGPEFGLDIEKWGYSSGTTWKVTR